MTSNDNELKAFSFWQRVDRLNSGKLNDLCRDAGLDYNKVKHNRSDSRFMTAVETLSLAKALNTSVEYLLTGSGGSVNPLAEKVYSYLEEKMPGTLEDILGNLKKAGSSGMKVG